MTAARCRAALFVALALWVGGGGVALAAPAPVPPAPGPGAAVPAVAPAAPAAPPAPVAPVAPVAPTGPTAPNPAGICANPPTAQGAGETVTGAFDVLAPATPGGTGLYSRYGWAGWGTTVYDPGCLDRVLSWVGDMAGPLSGPGVLAAGVSRADGPNRVTGWTVGLSVFVMGLLTTLVRLAVGPAGMWQVLDRVEDAVRSVSGAGFLVTFLGAALVLTGLWFLWRSRRDPLGLVLSQVWTAFLIVTAGIAVTLFQVTAGPSVDSAIQQTYAAAGQVAAGQTRTGPPETTSPGGPDPGTVLADAVTDHVMLPAWGVIHLGPDMGAVNTYAGRLYAAGAFTRAENARAQADPAVKKQLVDAKRRDYKAVAEEIRRSHPSAYEVLIGKNADQRMPWGALLLLMVVMIAAVTGIAAAIVAFSRVGLRLLVAGSPAIAVVTQHPVFQRYGLLAAQWIVRLVWASVLATAFLITFVRVVILVLGSGGSWIELMIAVIVLCGVLLWMWSRRSDIARQAGLLEHQRAMERSAVAARDAAAWTTAHADTAAGRLGSYLRDRRADRFVDGPDAEVTERAPAPAELEPVAAAPAVVRSVVVDRRDAIAVEAEKAAAADPVSVARRADPTEVSAVAARFAAARPSERSLAVRERAELAARTAGRNRSGPPATDRGPVTRAADRTVVHAVRASAAKSTARMATTGAVRAATAPVGGTAVAQAVRTVSPRVRR